MCYIIPEMTGIYNDIEQFVCIFLKNRIYVIIIGKIKKHYKEGQDKPFGRKN